MAVELRFLTTHFRVEVSNGSLAVFPVLVISEPASRSFVGESVMTDFDPGDIGLVDLAVSLDEAGNLAYELTLLNKGDQTVGDMSTLIGVVIEPRDEFASLLREFEAGMTRTEYRRTTLEAGEEAQYVEVYAIQAEGLDLGALSKIEEQAANVNVILLWDLTQTEITRFEP